MAKRSSHVDTIGLCPYHHRTSNESIHLNPKEFEKKFGTEKELLEYRDLSNKMEKEIEKRTKQLHDDLDKA